MHSGGRGVDATWLLDAAADHWPSVDGDAGVVATIAAEILETGTVHLVLDDDFHLCCSFFFRFEMRLLGRRHAALDLVALAAAEVLFHVVEDVDVRAAAAMKLRYVLLL